MSDKAKGTTIGQALLSIFLVTAWAVGVAAATTKGAVAIFFSLFPPIAYVFAAMWSMNLL